MIQLKSRYFVLLGAALLLHTGLGAQTSAEANHQEVDLAVTYTAQYSSLVPGQKFWQQGGSAELSAQVWHGLGVAANVTGTNIDNAAGSGVGLTMVTETFGPRYTWYRPMGAGKKKSLAVFGQSLIGEAHGFNSTFPQPRGLVTDYNSFALQVGGGVDIGLSRHIAVRAIQADWLRTQFPNSAANIQNNLRLGAGIVFRIPQHER
jgi:outer membrane immunogenic protein